MPTAVAHRASAALMAAPTKNESFGRRVHACGLNDGEITAWSADPDDRTLTFHLARTSDLSFDVTDVRAAIDQANVETWRIRVLTQPRETVPALVSCAPLALAALTPSPDHPPPPAIPPIASGRAP